MSNFDTAREALETSINSEGSAMEEHEKWMQSLEAGINKVKAAWQSLSQTFLKSNFLKGVLKGASGLLNVLDKLIGSFGTLGTVALGFGAFKMIKYLRGAIGLLNHAGWSLHNIGYMAKDAGKGLLTFSKTGLGAVTAIGALVGVASLFVNAYKKANQEASKARKEIIQSSDEFLDAANSFEAAYIKYSGKTDLTVEEEAELESAINGTVNALNDKTSALQSVVNGSNDYLASLDKIADAELKAATSAAKAKQSAAKGELKYLVKGDSGLDGSEVDVQLFSLSNLGYSTQSSEAKKIAKIAGDVEKEWYQFSATNFNGRDLSHKTMDFVLDPDADIDEIIDYYYMLIDFRERLLDDDLDDTDAFDKVNKVIEKMSASIDTYIDSMYEAAKAQYQFQKGIPKTTDEYLEMREAILRSNDIQGLALDARNTIANDLDSEYDSYFDLTSANALARKFIGLISNYGDGTKDGSDEIGTVETFLNMRTAVNNEECTVGQYLSQFDKISAMTEKWSDEEKEIFNTSIGFDSDSIKEQYDKVFNYIKRQYVNKVESLGFGVSSSDIQEIEEEIEGFLNNLSASELIAVSNIKGKIDWDNSTFEQVMQQVEKEARLVRAISFSVDLKVETEKLENLSTAISESISGAGLGSESISVVKDMFGDLDSYDHTELFEQTANGIRLNSEELRKLSDEYRKTNIDGFDDKVDALAERYYQAREELSDLTYGTKEYNAKLAELNNIEDQINATEQLATQYRGLASAYQSWQRAESAGSQRDMYEKMIDGFETVDDEISRGWLDDGTIEFLRLIKGESLSATATTKELVAAYKSLDDTIKNTTYSVRDFFTVDEDGNSTNTGVYNFLDAIGQLEEEAFGGKDVVKRDENGNIIAFDFAIAGGDKAVADALGISEELVQIMVRAADDAGFVISMDGTYQQLDTLKDKAQEAADKLKETFKATTYDFNINTGNENSVLQQYQEALKIWGTFKENKNKDGTINMSVDGAQEAFILVSTLQSMVDRLSEPTYMELDATQVEKDMQVPLSKLQEYERLTQQENQLKLKGTDTSEIEKSQEEILDYFENLKPEVQASLGIEGLTREEIEKKLEAGEIKIPATIDLQVEMNNTLRDMVNVALHHAGLIDEEELKKRVSIELYADKVDATDVEDKVEDAVNNNYWSDTSGGGGGGGFLQTSVSAPVRVIPVIDPTSMGELYELVKDYDLTQQNVIVKYIAEDKDVQNYTPEQKEALVKYIADGGSLEDFTPEEKQAFVQYLADGGDVEGYTPEDKKALAKYLVDGGDPEKYQPPSKTQQIDQSLDTSVVDDYQPAPKTLRINAIFSGIKNAISNAVSAGKAALENRFGIGGVDGTAHIDGTTGKAFKQGSWGTKNSGTALVGELGAETLVRDGRYYTIGNTGAEFIKYRKGDIIFNHEQTRQLFANGRVTSGGGRGKAFVDGTAFARGTGGIGKVSGVAIDGSKMSATTKTTTKKKKNLISVTNETNVSGASKGDEGGLDKNENGNAVGSDGSGTSDKDKFEDTIDFIEIAIDRIEREVDKLDQKTNNIYKSWSSRNKALIDEIAKVGDEISLQQSAYERYMQEANSVGLSEKWAKRVRNGIIDIYDENDFDEETAEKIEKYREWYEKALDCKDAIEELKETEASLYAQRVENVSAQFEGILGVIEHEKNILEEYISQSEANAQLVSGEYYKALIGNENENLAQLEKEKAAMLAELEAAMESGKIAKGSEAYYDMVASIDEVTLAIEQSNTALLEYKQTLQQLSWETFDLLQEKISAVAEEANFLIELLSSDKLFDDNGQLTDEGSATMGLHGQNYNSYMYQADLVAEEAERLRKELEQDPYDTELEARYREMIALQQEYILSAQQEKEAIRDLVEEGISLELDALQELIDKKNEALESERDLYEYQKKVKEQTEEIASLEKQMAAYSGDDSEEAKQKIQQIKVDLEEARQNLQETEYDRYISDQQQMLDDLYLEYEEILNMRLDNIDALLSDMIAEVNSDASIIGDTIRESADSVGYTLSDSMQTIWGESTADTINVITVYGEKFTNAQTTTNNALSTINTNLQNMIVQLNKLAEAKVQSASISSADNSNEANVSSKDEQPKEEPKKENTATIKVGGKINAGSAKIYDYAGDTSGERQYYRKDPIYTVLAEKNGYLKVRWHKLSKGTTGWFKKSDVKAYATGKKNFLDDEIAWTQEGRKQEFIVRPSDGAILTPIAKGDSVLNATASNNIWDMANSPAEFIKDNLNLGTTSVPNNSNVQSNYTQHLDKVVFNLPNVKNYEELLSAMQKDKNFERLILSMTIDQIAGKSSLTKGKSIR